MSIVDIEYLVEDDVGRAVGRVYVAVGVAAHVLDGQVGEEAVGVGYRLLGAVDERGGGDVHPALELVGQLHAAGVNVVRDVLFLKNI